MGNRIPIMPPRSRLIMAELLRAYPNSVTTDQLVELIYGDDEDGGPLSAMGCISIALIPVRNAAIQLGWKLANEGLRYRLALSDERAFRLGQKERQIYDAIKARPGMSYSELADAIGNTTTRSTIAAQISHLRKKLPLIGEHIPYSSNGLRVVAGPVSESGHRVTLNEVYDAIKARPGMTITEAAEKLGMNKITLQTATNRLRKKLLGSNEALLKPQKIGCLRIVTIQERKAA